LAEIAKLTEQFSKQGIDIVSAKNYAVGMVESRNIDKIWQAFWKKNAESLR